MIQCVRCGESKVEIGILPHGGALGVEIKSKICADCWALWNAEAVKVINEHRLNLSQPAARGFLSTQMKIFLKLIPPPSESVTLSTISSV